MGSRLSETKKRMEDDLAKANARYEFTGNQRGPAGNPRGALLSMKRFKQTQMEYRDLQEVLKKLAALFNRIQKEDIHPDECSARIFEIMETPPSQRIDYSEDDLLNELYELSRNHILKHNSATEPSVGGVAVA
jgi:hypothetical protein